MSTFLEIAQLENGDIVLREAWDEQEAEPESAAAGIFSASTDDSGGTAGGERPAGPSRRLLREPLVRIRFSHEVRHLLGNELVGVAEAMIDAATDFLDGGSLESEEGTTPVVPVIH